MRAEPLRHDALAAKFAGFAEYDRAFILEMVVDGQSWRPRLLYVGIVDSLSSQVNDFGWLRVEESDMKYLALASLCTALASLAVFLLVTALTDANAVCARGVYRAGCAGPHGVFTAHRTARGTYAHPSVPIEASSVKDTENTPVVSTTKSEQRLKTLARQSDKPKERYYATAISQAYDFTAR